jgi:ATP-binding cassette subfamily B (MDR/TAP) protein 1
MTHKGHFASGRGVGRKLGELIMYTFVGFGAIGYAFWASWQASLVVLAVIPLMSLSALFVLKMNTTTSARAAEAYSEAGGIVYNTISSLRTILSLNAVLAMVEKFKDATQRAFVGAAGLAYLVGLATGSMLGCMVLTFLVVTLYGAFLLYDNVRKTGCDPSGMVDANETCDPRAADIIGKF